MSVEQQEKGQDKGQAGALTGKTFGGYRIGETLGSSSGASTVYAAEATTGGDKVALRVFAVDLSKDKNLSSRLVADVQKACAVSHPNLVPVREIGTADFKGKRHLYIAMERLEGESLKSRLAQKGASSQPLALPRALHIASEVGAALQAIHRANGTHRQVNLGSVFIKRGGEPDQEKICLLDLGCALVPSDSGGDKGGKAGKGGKIQDDIRSLAHLVQEMLGGVATDGQAVLPLRLRNPKVPARLDAVLRSTLGDTLGAPDRSSRFDSIGGLVAALLGTGEIQPTYMAWSEDGRTAPRPRATVNSGLLLTAGAIAVIIGILVVGWIYAQDTPAPAAADLAAVQPAPTPAPAPSETKSGPAPAPSAAADAGAAAGVGRPGAWPPRTGVIPPLRDGEPATPAPAAAPPAGSATPPAVRAPAPAPATGASAPPAAGAAPPVVRAPAPAPAGGAGAGPPSAPAAPKTPPAAKPPAPPQGPGAPAPAGPSGPKEVK
jgi:hypothetical protein